MIVREGSLIIQNVICVEEVISHADWYIPVLALRRNLVNEDIYYTSPVMFQVEEVEGNAELGKYTYYVGLNTEVEIPEDAAFKQIETLEVGPAIYVRCSEEEELDEAYELLEQYAQKKQWKLDPTFFHVSFDLFDDMIMDIYARVEEGGLSSW